MTSDREVRDERDQGEEVPEIDVGFDDAAGEPDDLVDEPPPDEPLTDDGEALPDEVRAELEALAAAELESGTQLEQALASAQRELAAQRAQARAALDRYREAVLAAEPELPPDLLRGDTLEELESAIASARDVVARVRERVREAPPPPGFPVGAPARDAGRRPGSMTPAEKIAAGLEERERGA